MQSNLSRLPYNAVILILLLFVACRIGAQPLNPYPTIGSIPLPGGYHRLPAASTGFAGWLRNIPLKKDRGYDRRRRGADPGRLAGTCYAGCGCR